MKPQFTTLTHFSTVQKVEAAVEAAVSQPAKLKLLTDLTATINYVGGKGASTWLQAVFADEDGVEEGMSLPGCRTWALRHFRLRLGIQSVGENACGESAFIEGGGAFDYSKSMSKDAKKSAKKIEEQQREERRENATMRMLLAGGAADISWRNDAPRDTPRDGEDRNVQLIELQAQLRADQQAFRKKAGLPFWALFRLIRADDYVGSTFFMPAYDEGGKLIDVARLALLGNVTDGMIRRPESLTDSFCERGIKTAYDVLSAPRGAATETQAKSDLSHLEFPEISFMAVTHVLVDSVFDAAAQSSELPYGVTFESIVASVKTAFGDWVAEALRLVESLERAKLVEVQCAALTAELDEIALQTTLSRAWKHVDREAGGNARNARRLLLVLVARVHLYLLQARCPITPLHLPTLGKDVLKHYVEFAACRADEIIENAAADERLAHSATALSAKPKSKASAAATGQVTHAMTNQRRRALAKWKRHKSVRDGSFGREHPSGAVERVVAMLGNDLHSFANIPTGPLMWGDRVRMTAILAEWDAHCDAAQLNPLTALPRE